MSRKELTFAYSFDKGLMAGIYDLRDLFLWSTYVKHLLQTVFVRGGKPTSEQEMTINDAKKPDRIVSFGVRLILRLVVLKMVRTFLFRKILWPLTNENGFFQRFLEIIREFRIPSPSAFHEFVFYWLIEEGFREIVGCVGVPSVKAIGD